MRQLLSHDSVRSVLYTFFFSGIAVLVMLTRDSSCHMVVSDLCCTHSSFLESQCSVMLTWDHMTAVIT